MSVNNSNEENNKDIQRRYDELDQELKNLYPGTYEKLKAFYNELCTPSFNGKSVDKINRVLQSIQKYENYTRYYSYNIHDNIYNFDKFYVDYMKDIGNDKSKDMLFEDLVYLFKNGYINLFVPTQIDKYFHISENRDISRNYYPFLENLCKLYNGIRNGRCNINAIIYFTADGNRYRKEKLLQYTIDQVIDKQKELQKEQDNLKEKINSYSKEIISIVAIILAIAPLIVINVSALKDFTKENLLVINGCLIIAITTICSVLNIAFFELKLKHLWLFAPIIIGAGLIVLG